MPAADSSSSKMARVHYRDLWGMADLKRAALLSGTAGEYETFAPTLAQRFKFVPYDAVGGYEEWPALDELFPEAYQGVNPNRGIEGSLIDVDREELADRMRDYFSDLDWDELARRYSELCSNRARYVAKDVRDLLRREDAFQDEQIIPYLQVPLDSRFIYYGTKAKLLNERRPEMWENREENEFLATVPEPRQVSESRPLLATGLFDLHLHDRGSVGFPAFTTPKAAVGTLFDDPAPPVPTANLAPAAWQALRAAYGLGGDLTGEAARGLVRRLFRAALALGHAPRFEADHRESLAQDWMHLPLPKDAALLAELAKAGGLVATLLDPLQNARPALRAILGGDYARLATLKQAEGAEGPLDLAVTYRYFGGGRGHWELRPPLASALAEGGGPLGEGWREAWGEAAGDLYLNPTTYLANVPERVWRYELGGYPVVKKWLGYRQENRRGGKPLTDPELTHLRGIVHRLAALLALHSRLDSLYERVIENAFTAEELGLRKVDATA